MNSTAHAAGIAADARTRRLLLAGVVAGPLYVAVTLAQALTREGFDITRHRFTLLTSGDLGWIHQANMLLVGTLTMLLAIGAARVLRGWRGATWGPRLLGFLGAMYFLGGLLVADPVPGFPPGTTAVAMHATWQAGVQEASRGASTLALIATSLVIAGWFSARGQRRWAIAHAASVPVLFAALAGLGLALGGNPAAPAFLATPWIWVTMLAVTLLHLTSSARAASPHVGARQRHGVG